MGLEIQSVGAPPEKMILPIYILLACTTSGIAQYASLWNKNNGNKSILDIAMVLIEPNDLVLLLESKAALQFVDKNLSNQTFLERFPRYLLAFGESEDDDDIYLGASIDDMRKILNLVADYNIRLQDNIDTSNVIELWVSILPTKNISGILNRTLDIINDSNTKYSGTITKILLNYRSLQLTKGTIPLLNEDIKIAKRLVHHHSRNIVQTGIILERYNCIGDESIDNLMVLELDKDDELVFLTQIRSDDDTISSHMLRSACMFIGGELSRKISGDLVMTITINLSNNSFSFYPPDDSPRYTYIVGIYSRLHVQNSVSFLVLKAVVGDIHEQQKRQHLKKSKKVDKAWLERPINFEKSHFGVSVYPPDDLYILPQLMPQLFGMFRRIIVESRKPNFYDSISEIAMVRSMAQYKSQLVRQEMYTGKPGIFGDGISVKMIMMAELLNENGTLSLKGVEVVYNTAIAANTDYPGIVDGIALNWMTCAGNETCTSVFNDYPSPEKIDILMEMLPTFIRGFVHMKSVIGEGLSIKIGAVWEANFCVDLRMIMTMNDFVSDVFSHVDFYILRLSVTKDTIAKNGAQSTALSIIQTAKYCERIMLDRNYTTNHEQQEKVPFYIKLRGCSDDTADIHEQKEIIKFWQLFNSWAVKENHSVYFETAFDYRTTNANYSRNCSVVDATMNPFGSCNCGWWKVTRNISTNNRDELILEDRKSVVAKLYSKLDSLSNQIFPSGSSKNLNLNNKWMKPLLISTIVALLTSALTFLIIYLVCKQRFQTNHGQELSTFLQGGSNTEGRHDRRITLDGSGRAESQAYNKEKYELGRSAFRIDFAQRLGSGAFGTVFGGSIHRDHVDFQVAVKMMKTREKDSSHGHYLALKGLISEIKILSYVGEHDNIIKLQGAYTAKLKQNKLLVFLEFCELGSLDKYLRAYNPIGQRGENSINTVALEEGAIEMKTTNLQLSDDIVQDLERWAAEIAGAMEFLTTKKIVHADLATRNILLDNQKSVKLSDFGLSRRLYEYSEYLKKEAEPLPWRWMAPESLRRNIFNEKTDVWSFGVTLWEMFTLGDEPYPGLTWSDDFPALLERGVRLQEPTYNRRGVHSLMKSCWDSIPDRRPAFSQLKIIFVNRRDMNNYVNL